VQQEHWGVVKGKGKEGFEEWDAPPPAYEDEGVRRPERVVIRGWGGGSLDGFIFKGWCANPVTVETRHTNGPTDKKRSGLPREILGGVQICKKKENARKKRRQDEIGLERSLKDKREPNFIPFSRLQTAL
jgi:hypothetical protein